MTCATDQHLSEPQADVDQMRRAVRTLFGSLGEGVAELRALKVPEGRDGQWPKNRSGYFNDTEALVAEAAKLNDQGGAVYITLNPCKPELLSRCGNRTKVTGKDPNATKDHEILRRHWLPIDTDPVRPRGICSTDAERANALNKAQEIKAFLADHGWPEPVEAESGNGGHLLYRVDLPREDGDLLSSFLTALSERFTDENVDVDKTVHNASRIWKLYGSVSKKGDHTVSRPHRVSRITMAPAEVATVTDDMIRSVTYALTEADQVAEPLSQDERSQLDTEITVESQGDRQSDPWLLARIKATGLAVSHTKTIGGGPGYVLEQCPFCREADGAASVGKPAGKGYFFKCHHNRCSDRGWVEFKALWEGESGSALPSQEWESPLPFEPLDRPEFPVEVLPDWLRDWVESQAHATQVAPALPGCMGLAALSVAASRLVDAVRVRPKWSEPVNIFAAVALPPGTLKSSNVKAALEPIEAFEADEVDRLREKIRAAEQRQRELDQRRKYFETKAAKAEKFDERDRFRQLAHEAQEELAQHHVPVIPRLYVDDVTPEKFADLLAQHDGSMAILSAEGGIFGLMAGRYSGNGESNFEVWLKGHAGDSLRVDRKSSGAISVANPRVTLGITFQPSVLEQIGGKSDFKGRGLLARFLYAVPRTLVGGRDWEASKTGVNEGAQQEYGRRIRALLDLRPSDSEWDLRELTLSPGAVAAVDTYMAWAEPKLTEGEAFGGIAEWACKSWGAVVRLAALLHMAEWGGTGDPWDRPIGADSVESAVRLMRGFFLPHAGVALSAVNTGGAIGDAKALWAVIARKKWAGFSKRELNRSVRGRGRFKQSADLNAGLGCLDELGYVRRVEAVGRKERFEVNPLAVGSIGHVG